MEQFNKCVVYTMNSQSMKGRNNIATQSDHWAKNRPELKL